MPAFEQMQWLLNERYRQRSKRSVRRSLLSADHGLYSRTSGCFEFDPLRENILGSTCDLLIPGSRGFNLFVAAPITIAREHEHKINLLESAPTMAPPLTRRLLTLLPLSSVLAPAAVINEVRGEGTIHLDHTGDMLPNKNGDYYEGENYDAATEAQFVDDVETEILLLGNGKLPPSLERNCKKFLKRTGRPFLLGHDSGVL